VINTSWLGGALVTASALACASMALAAEPAQQPGVAPGTDVIIELGLGGRIAPAYDGSSDYELKPFPIIRPRYVHVPGLFEVGGRKGEGFSVGPSFGYTGERNSDDYGDLLGLRDVDPTYEAGLRVGYGWDYAEVYAKGRYAFGGAHGLVGEVGANAILRPMERLELKAGPVVSFAAEGYMDEYFGVTPAEAAATAGRLQAYDADGGVKSVGLAMAARYEFRPDWFVEAEASYSRLVADAADSPIVDVGSEDQFTVGLGVSRRFTLDLF
jgi:outer membrane scaffolding protein for murein synthesis (MipA/OmpV family)